MRLNERIYSVLQRMLNEELGINQSVYEGANEILLQVRRSIDEKDINSEYSKVFQGMAYKTSGEFHLNFENVDVKIKYDSYLFKDDATYSAAKKLYKKKLMNACSFSDGNNIELRIVYNRTLENGYDDSICDRIQHELDHAFKTIKKQGVLADSSLKHDVNKGLRLKGEDDELYYASWILYCSRKYEQDACANGLYNWLCNGNGDKNEIVHKSALVRNRRI